MIFVGQETLYYIMRSIVVKARWNVISEDINVFKRDGLVILQKP